MYYHQLGQNLFMQLRCIKENPEILLVLQVLVKLFAVKVKVLYYAKQKNVQLCVSIMCDFHYIRKDPSNPTNALQSSALPCAASKIFFQVGGSNLFHRHQCRTILQMRVRTSRL